MYIRNDYLKWMGSYIETPLIKVLVGMRRTGKSTLLQQFRHYLIKERNYTDSQILFIDMESLANRDIIDEIALYDRVNSFFKDSKGKRILFIGRVMMFFCMPCPCFTFMDFSLLCKVLFMLELKQFACRAMRWKQF